MAGQVVEFFLDEKISQQFQVSMGKLMVMIREKGVMFLVEFMEGVLVVFED